MPSLLNTVDPELIFAMFKGEPGTRKSTQALSFPGPQYWFSFDRKMSGILVPFREWKLPPTHVEFDDYDNWDKARVKLESFQVNCPYQTIVIDSITSMADTTIRQSVTDKVKDNKGKKIGTIPVAGIEEYNAEASALMEMIALLKDIQSYHATKGKKIKVIIIAHVIQAEYKDSKGLTHFSRTVVTAGKRVAPKIPVHCTEVYHFNVKTGGGFQGGGGTGKYALLTEHTGDDFARTSLNLPTEIEFGNEPLYDKWIKPAIATLKG